MAPRKPVSPVKPRRLTRARAADADNKKAQAETTKSSSTNSRAGPKSSAATAIETKSRVSKRTSVKPSSSPKPTASKSRAAKARAVAAALDSEHEDTMAAEQPVRTSRSNRTATATQDKPVSSGLAAAPRRRIKVTPLDRGNGDALEPIEPAAEERKKSIRATKYKSSDLTVPTSRGVGRAGRVAASRPAEQREPGTTEPLKRVPGRATKPVAEAGLPHAEPKARGRPKRENGPTDVSQPPATAPTTTRQTRARAASASSSVALDAPVPSKPVVKKKVTFQDVPNSDDEKENRRPVVQPKSRAATKRPAAAKKAAAESKQVDPAPKGMRAKPIRKPASSKPSRATSAKKPMQTVEEADGEATLQRATRVLTPKKILQVAKVVPVDSDDEDELAGEETPIRDLTPPRKHASPSPVKQLHATPPLEKPQMPAEVAPLLSPPRRMPSPHKDPWAESPRRAPDGVVLFPAQIRDAYINTPGHTSPRKESALHQSPKRGLGDRIVFPPSAIKPRGSPVRATLLSSPARRLFSPAKRGPASRTPPSAKRRSLGVRQQSGSPGDVDIAMSSHFRPSMSPQRSAKVYKLSDAELARDLGTDLDFDQSVLSIRSPLKVAPSQSHAQETCSTIEADLPMISDELLFSTREDCAEPTPNIQLPFVPDEVADCAPGDVLGHNDATRELTLSDDGSSCSHVAVRRISQSPAISEVASPPRQQPTTDLQSQKTVTTGRAFKHLRELNDESEDELSTAQTPDSRIFFRPTLSNSLSRGRISTGIAPDSAARNVGYTPLAAQVHGWRASSPKKGRANESSAFVTTSFSPAARMHVEGSVELTRQKTPLRSAHKKKSLGNRFSIGLSTSGSPAPAHFFADSMAAQDFDDETRDQLRSSRNGNDLHDLVQTGEEVGHDVAVDLDQPTIEGAIEEVESNSLDDESCGLTTDLVKFTHASDTAMVDFKALADEADERALHEHSDESTLDEIHHLEGAAAEVTTETQEADDSLLSTSSEMYGDENEAPRDEVPTVLLPPRHDDQMALTHATEVDDAFQAERGNSIVNAQTLPSADEELVDAVYAHSAEPIETTETDLLANTTSPMPAEVTTSKDANNNTVEMDFDVTPIRPNLDLPRFANTVVSKVPLRPEGQAPSTSSPVKVQRKRPRSLSSLESLPNKRQSLGFKVAGKFAAKGSMEKPSSQGNILSSSPQRRVRSAAPSPAQSLAGQPMTPGRMSFCIDNFGDSTLDGIELPSDELGYDDMDANSVGEGIASEGDASMYTIDSAMFRTPVAYSKRPSDPEASDEARTPGFMRSTKSSRSRSSSTHRRESSGALQLADKAQPTTKTPKSAGRSKTSEAERETEQTPLKALNTRILHGAVVHYDIHTAEGQDASGVFVELLTAMGARCIKEWRWNPRSTAAMNLATTEETPFTPELASTAIGITHVIYKDGGKRTLEKVRSAHGQVRCVGVGWVLDCYREGKWLDEATYTVDANIFPRGGSRRRRSMEPRMLMNDNGVVSSPKGGRRSLPADEPRLTQQMKDELINTPIRGREERDSIGRVDEHERREETEISSSYSSPAIATAGGEDETRNVDFVRSERDLLKTPLPASAKQPGFTTPESISLTVNYDPRTAATPLTPYFAAKQKGLGQMSAPPKQIGRGMFDGGEEDEDEIGRGQMEKGAGQKFPVKKSLGAGLKKAGHRLDVRRRTLGASLGFQPAVGSPLRKV